MNRTFIFALSIVLTLGACKKTTPVEYIPPTPYNLEVPPGFPQPPIAPDNPLTVEGVELGKKLFFSTLLSKDLTMSCGSCHFQEFGFTDSLKAVSLGVRNVPGNRNSMPIFNLAWHNNGFFWDGRAELLRDQSLGPIPNPLELDVSHDVVVSRIKNDAELMIMFAKAFGTIDISIEHVSLAMEQYMNSIVSGNSKFDKFQRGEATLTPAEERGRKLFFTEAKPGMPGSGADCFHCHGGPLFTNNEFMNNGLDTIFLDNGRFDVTFNPADMATFKTPSMRNVELTAPYMHDGRFATLEEVIDHYNAEVLESPTLDPNMHTIKDGLGLSAGDKSDLIAFLKSLTDEEFKTNMEYMK